MRLLFLLAAAACGALPADDQSRGASSWLVGDWQACSQSCGNGGVQRRLVYCHRVNATTGEEYRVKEAHCLHEHMPDYKQHCNRFACPTWSPSKWSTSCTVDGSPEVVTCGGGAIRKRHVVCRSNQPGDPSEVPSTQCPSSSRPHDYQFCDLPACEGLRWVVGEWRAVEQTVSTKQLDPYGIVKPVQWFESREVRCVDAHGTEHPIERCQSGTLSPQPNNKRALYKWHVTPWSECGRGERTRNVTCESEYWLGMWARLGPELTTLNITGLSDLEAVFEVLDDEARWRLHDVLFDQPRREAGAPRPNYQKIRIIGDLVGVLEELRQLFGHRGEGCGGARPATVGECPSKETCATATVQPQPSNSSDHEP